MGPEDELSDQAPETADDAEVVPAAGPADSHLDFAEGAGDAPDEYVPDENAPKVDLSGELAEDAGERASYGFEAASEAPVEPEVAPDELTSIASTGADDSDKYRIHEVASASDSTGFADEAGEQPHDDTYDPPAEEAVEDEGVGYVSAAQASEADDQIPPVDDEPAAVQEEPLGEAPPVDDEPPPVEEQPVEEQPVEEQPVEEQPVEEPPVQEEVRAAPRRAAPPPKSGRVSRPAAAAASDDEPRPGQIRKSVLDEIFARAAEIKKQK